MEYLHNHLQQGNRYSAMYCVYSTIFVCPVQAKFAVCFNTQKFFCFLITGSRLHHLYKIGSRFFYGTQMEKCFFLRINIFGWSACKMNWAYLQILIHRWTSRILSLGSTERKKQNELQTLTFPTIIISWLISRKFLVLVKKTHKLYRQSNSDLL